MDIRCKKYSDRECGNALFLILIAVALFAALSYAVTQSGRGTGSLDPERASISAAQITQYPALLSAVITRMMVTGVAVTTITFDAAAGDPWQVFDPAGGAAVLDKPPPNIGNATAWGFEPDTGAAGYYVKDVGTNGNAGREVLAYLEDISLTVCTQIQKGLGLTQSPIPVPTVDIVWGAPAAAYNTAGSTIKGATLDGRPFSCMNNASGT